MSRAEIVQELLSRRVHLDQAVLYADSFCEYREAQANINAHGSIVQHPRTGNPIPNPYLPIRDAALRRLKAMRGLDVGFLWVSTSAGPRPAV